MGPEPGIRQLLIVVESGCEDCSPRMYLGMHKTVIRASELDTGGERQCEISTDF